MRQKRIGNQSPTRSYILPYKRSKGKDAAALYKKTGRKLAEWQEQLLSQTMAFNSRQKLWEHSRFGYAVPRRNGKSEVVIARCLWGIVEGGEQILYTSHRTKTSHSMWERLSDLLSLAGYVEGDDYKTLKQLGFESIEILKDGGGRISFSTRSSKGGLGEGYDLLVIDEAQEYTDDQASALKYLVSSSKNPQTVMMGTPPTVTSSGTVFQAFRDDVLSGKNEYCGWAEWSIEHQSDPLDVDLWYLTNPAMGTILTERDVKAEYTGDDLDFNIQRLGLWVRHNLKSAISAEDWGALRCPERPNLTGPRFVGVKFGVDGVNCAVSVAAKTDDGRIFIEGLDCRSVREGYDWIIGDLSRLNAKTIVIDGKSGQQILPEMMNKAKIRGKLLPAVAEIVQANAVFEQGVYNLTLCHMDQPAMTQAATNCEKRPIGSNGGFGYKSQKEGIEIALLDSAILAFWACTRYREGSGQKISY